ncbi:MAG: ABC transporter substrate-binding protein [Suipraeoptans sp.]
MKKKLISIVLCVVLIMSLTACGNGESSDESTKTEGEKIELEFINGTNEEPYIAWLDEMIEKYETDNPDVKINITKVSVDSFNQTVMTRYAAGDVPDLITFTENDIDDMVPSGYIADLSNSANISNYDEGMLDTLSLDGKVYALPLFNDFMCVTYNRDVFEQAGISEAPKTWSEFMNALDELSKVDGITPIASGFSEQWVVNGTSQTTYCASVLGNDGPTLAEMVNRDYKFTENDQWKDFFQKLQDMYPYMNDDPFGVDQNACYSQLANGEAAMILNGTWTSTNTLSTNPDANLGIFALPISENEEDNKMPMNPPANGFAVSEDSKYKEEAIKFVEFLTSSESATVYAEKGAGIPIVKGVDTSGITGTYKDAADMMNNDEVKVISSKSFPSANEDAFINDVSEFFLSGCEDIEGALKALDDDFDNLIKE